jgi:hypothetical protein
MRTVKRKEAKKKIKLKNVIRNQLWLLIKRQEVITH